jgi:hypothetical protein
MEPATDDVSAPLDEREPSNEVEPEPSSRAPAPQRVPPPRAIEPPAQVVRTGSSDKHLIHDDEPLAPEPPRRPRTYRDLDAIPDDLD